MYEKTYTKKELEERFSISKNTVYDTIKACGLDTSKAAYTEAEIETRFAPARHLLESKQATYATLKDHFSMRSAQAAPNVVDAPQASSQSDQPQASQPVEAGEFLEAVHQELTQSFEVMVESAVFDVIQRLPEIAMRAANGARHRGELRRVFAQARQEFLNAPPTFQPSEAREALDQALPTAQPPEPDVLVDWQAAGEDAAFPDSDPLDERSEEPPASH